MRFGKRERFDTAVKWIAWNDEPNEMSLDVIRDSVSVCLIADLFDKDPTTVAKEVRKWRKTLNLAKAYSAGPSDIRRIMGGK